MRTGEAQTFRIFVAFTGDCRNLGKSMGDPSDGLSVSPMGRDGSLLGLEPERRVMSESGNPVLMVSREDVVVEPFPHCFKQPFVRPDLFERLKAEFPRDDYFDRNSSLGGRAGRDLYPGDDLYDELLGNSPAWREFAEFIDSQAYIDLTLDLFGDHLAEFGCLADAEKIRYEHWVESREILAEKTTRSSRVIGKIKGAMGIAEPTDEHDPNEMFVRMDIAQGEVGYEKRVHCDRPNRLTSMLIYFCDKNEIGMEGGDFRVHKHNEDKPIDAYERHPKPTDTEIVATFEPKENFGGMFIGCNNSYHSATAVTRSDSYRNFVYSSVASRARRLWR